MLTRVRKFEPQCSQCTESREEYLDATPEGVILCNVCLKAEMYKHQVTMDYVESKAKRLGAEWFPEGE